MTIDEHVGKQRPERTTSLSEGVIELLRYRIEARYYDRPQVVEAVARALLARAAPGR